MRRINSPDGVHAGDVMTFYYTRPAPTLLRPMIEDLLPLNGPGTNRYDPLTFFLAALIRRDAVDIDDVLASETPGVPALMERALFHADTPAARARCGPQTGEPHDVIAYGARGANSVNCLWAHFFATGERAAIQRMIEALDSWHWVLRRMRSQGMDPARTVIDGAGKDVRWSLESNAWQHARVRAICEAEVDSTRYPLGGRDELAAILAKAATREPNPREPATIAFLEANGGRASTEDAPIEAATGGASPGDLAWLRDVPPEAWLKRIPAQFPELDDVEAAVRARGSAAPLETGALCLGARFNWLAARELERAAAMATSDPVERLMARTYRAFCLHRIGTPDPEAPAIVAELRATPGCAELAAWAADKLGLG